MTQKKNDTQTSAQDLKDHGKNDIIPENEEYYTLDLKRDFDGLNDDDDETTVDIIGDNPLDDDETAEVIDTENEDEGVDEDNEDGAEVGEPGHWGVDEDTD